MSSQDWQGGSPRIWSWLSLTQHVDYCPAGDLEVTGDFIMCFENRISAWAKGSNIHKNSLLNAEGFISSRYPSGCPLGGFADEGSSCSVSGEWWFLKKERAMCAGWQCRNAEAPPGQPCEGTASLLLPSAIRMSYLGSCCHNPQDPKGKGKQLLSRMTGKWGVIISYDGDIS